ncbi:dioxygenase [Burkholderia multivorans]|uniref:dioxygenase n=1 Tax=Burkholderia multivorans TaxID=87883 RepID=UPI000CFF0508|nr:dioxygenase [Burkholderia multivorans]MBU9584125.1 hydroxyquinol 1,2-dioxygenase [Burkholderia multivorans]MCL4653745.1 hydroxyquinol 1,2-dioxygenase [Burkholderia multivorans]MCL4659258.1 hydroxyquinol 1,2-dioxygenase [Burkholderia multivorans]PRF29038.1 hydroxyquinol 1,2-dioxygenase [Burkholderia multivorans]
MRAAGRRERRDAGEPFAACASRVSRDEIEPSSGARADDSPSAIADTVRVTSAACEDGRLKTIMSALVRHLHGFARELELTPAERRCRFRELGTIALTARRGR